MQIEQIALYHHDGRRRVLRFKLDALNIVYRPTGRNPADLPG
jgi:hypothetical protein